MAINKVRKEQQSQALSLGIELAPDFAVGEADQAH